MRLSPPIAQPKPKPAKPRTNWKAADRQGSEDVTERSGGLCEVVEMRRRWHQWFGDTGPEYMRCFRPATQIHHMIGGWKRRGRGMSAQADRKQHVCDACHRAITGDVGVKLKRVGGPVPHYSDCYERVG